MNQPAVPHYVADYEKLVSDLVAAHSPDEAMSRAVGGGYEIMGRIQMAALRRAHASLRAKQPGNPRPPHVVDVGCGSGRLSTMLSSHYGATIEYFGLDIIQRLVDYAKSRAHPSYRFAVANGQHIPCVDSSVDFITCFSVFTHLHQAECYRYLEEMRRVLRRGGIAIVSYQSLTDGAGHQSRHWNIFEETVEQHRAHGGPWPHLNMFIEHSQMDVMSSAVGFDTVEFVDSHQPILEEHALGQHMVYLRKR